MSLPEPPPSSTPWAPPTAAPPPPPAWNGSTAVPSIVPNGATAAIRSSRGLATATLALYWCRTGAAALQALAFLHRRSVISTAIKHSAAGGITRSDVDADERARALIVAAAVLLVVLTIAAAILTSLWSRRIAENARARGDRTVRPGLATGGWYIPIGWYWVGFNQIKGALSRAGRAPNLVTRWQTAFIIASVISAVALRADPKTDTLEQLKSSLGTGVGAIAIGLVLFVWCTIAATKALRSTTDALG